MYVVQLWIIFLATLPLSCPQSLSLLNLPPASSSSCSPLICSYNSQRSSYVPYLLSSGFLLSTSELQAQLLVSQMLSERNLSWVPPAAPSFLPPTCYLSDLHTCQIFMPLWSLLSHPFCWNWPTCSKLFDNGFMSLRQESEKQPTNQRNLLFLSLSKKNNPLRSVCTLSIVIHWTVRTCKKWELGELKVCGSPNNRRTAKNPGKKTSDSALYFFLAKTKVSLMPRGWSEKQNMSGTGFPLPPWIPGGDCGSAAAAPQLCRGRCVGWHPKHYSCPSVCRWVMMAVPGSSPWALSPEGPSHWRKEALCKFSDS